jgi:hypothetical protein
MRQQQVQDRCKRRLRRIHRSQPLDGGGKRRLGLGADEQLPCDD